MNALKLEDLLPLEEFAARRRELFEAQCRWLDRYRRVRIGPRASLLFENRQTVWFRLQDVLRIARLSDPVRVQQELAMHNRLLPGIDRLHAALLIEVDPSRLSQDLAPWTGLQGEDVCLIVGQHCCSSYLVTCRPEDRCIGAAHWVHFHLDSTTRSLLGDYRVPVHVEIRLPSYSHASPTLGEDVRQSLLDDLAMSDRSRAA